MTDGPSEHTFYCLKAGVYKTPKGRVSDPHGFNADPDPTFFLIADPNPGLFCEFNIVTLLGK